MICVTLGRARHKRMIAEHQYLVEQGAELVELRLDYIGRAVNLNRLPDGRPFFAMKQIKGKTLSELLKQRTAIVDSLPHYVGIFEQIFSND